MNSSIIVKILVCVSLTFIAAGSQSLSKIEGYIYDENGMPLAGADVAVVGTGYGAATDAIGYFNIENLFTGEYRVQVSYVGYKSETRANIIVSKDVPATLFFKLVPLITTTTEIVVEADREIDQLTKISINITAEDIEKSSARTLGELLIQIPGISIIDEGAGSGQKRISIRGSNPNQVLVMLDGIPLNDPLTGEVDLNLIPVSIIESVSIKKGGNSAESGSGSIGGSVEITSRQEFLDEITFAANAGSFGARGLQPSLSGKLSGINYYVGYEIRTEEGDYPYTYQKPDGEIVTDNRLNAGFKSEQYFVKLGFISGAHKAAIQLNIFDSQRGLPGTVYFLTPYALADVTRKIVAGNYTYKSNQAMLALQLSAHNNRSEYENLWPPDPPLKYKTVPPYHRRYEVTSYQGQLNGSYKWLAQNQATIRLSYRRDIFRDENLLIPGLDPISETDNRQFGIALENDWDFPSPDWIQHSRLLIAGRYDHIRFLNTSRDRTDEYFSPRIGILIGHHDEWILNFSANLGKSFRSPTFGDLFYQDFRVRGNADLLPEKSLDFDISLNIGLPWLHQPEFGITYFRQNLENLIIWELGSFATWQPVNLDAFIDGWEYTLQWDIWPQYLSLHLDHTFLNARDRSGRHTTNDKFLTYRPRHTTKMKIEFRYQPFTLQYFKRIVGERYVTPANTVSLPGYTADDVSLLAGFPVGNLDFVLKLMILNLFDTRYEIIEHAPLPGRHWRTGIEIKY